MPQVLAAFVQSILDLPNEVETAGSESKEGDAEEAGRAKKFVKRYLKWQAARTQVSARPWTFATREVMLDDGFDYPSI